MTALQKLRHHQGLLVGLILFALFAFVIGEVISNSDRIFSSDRTTVAKVGDKTLGIEEYRSATNELVEQYRDQNLGYGQAQEQVYQKWISENILEAQYEKAGVVVGPSGTMNGILKIPEVQQNFSNAFGQADENLLRQWAGQTRTMMDQGDQQAVQNWQIWLDWKSRGLAIQKSALYADMISAALEATKLDAKIEYAYQNNQVDGIVAYLPYTSIADSEVPVTDKEIEVYIAKNKNDFKRPDTRDLQYAFVPITASDKDAQVVKENITKFLDDRIQFNNKTNATDTIPGFAHTANDSTFVNSASDASARYEGRYITSLGNEEAQAWVENTSKGNIYGPYLADNSYKISKLIDTRMMADSINISQILIGFENAPYNNVPGRTLDQARAKTDSLISVLRSGKVKFEEMVIAHSDDPGKEQNGGSIGWVTYAGSSPITDNLFTKQKGSLELLETQAGFAIISINDAKNFSKAYKVATISKRITPSKESTSAALTKAQKLATSTKSAPEFVVNAQKEGFQIASAPNVSILQSDLPSLGDRSNIVRWAYEKNTAIGDVKIFDIPGYHIVAIVAGSREEGLLSADESRPMVEPILIKEKKTKLLEDKFKAAKGSVQEIAKATSAEFIEAASLTLASPIIPAAGRAPRTVGYMFGAKLNQVSAPIADITGVYVASTTAKRDAEAITDYSSFQKGLTAANQSGMNAIMAALEAKSEVKDNRAKIEKLYN